VSDHRTLRRRGAHREPLRRPGRTRLLRGLAVLAVAAVVTVVVARVGTTESPAGSDARQRESWADLVQWADAELPTGTSLLVPDELLADATAAGADERLRPLDADVTGARVLVTSEEPPPGSAVLARFGTSDTTGLTVVDPAPGLPTTEELQRRQRLSAAVLANPNTGATGRAAEILQDAEIDARLLGLLAVLVAQLDVGIADFPPADGEPADGVLARSVLLDRVGTEPLATGNAVTDRLLTFVDAQLPPFAPQRVQATDDGVLIEFRYESAPDALVSEQTP
jgi:hypothetical protein